MAKLHLVWNVSKSQCVGFVDKADADFTATGKKSYLRPQAQKQGYFSQPTLGLAFRECYGDEGKRLPQTTVETPDVDAQ